MFESDLDNATENRYAPKEELLEEGAVALAGKKTQETLTATNLIIEALDIAEEELDVLLNMRKRKPGGNVAEFQPDIRMLGLSPSHYVLRTLSNVKTNDLEQTLLALPFADALKLLSYLKDWASNPDKEKMIELQEETQAGEREKTEAEICEEVLGKASGFNQNFAFSQIEHQSTATEAELRCIVHQQENKIKQLEDQLILFDQQKEKIKSLEHQQFVLLEMMKQLTITLELQQSDKAPIGKRLPSPTDEDSSSSATTISNTAIGDT